MATVVLFPSVLGVRSGLRENAAFLREAGHTVHVIDVYDGIVFDEYPPAMEYAEEEVGMPRLMAMALAAVADIPGPMVTAGFSNGAGMAEFVATQRPSDVTGVLMFGGGIPVHFMDATWPPGVPGQIHHTEADPWHEREADLGVTHEAYAAGAKVEIFGYPGSGHLFADESKADEFQPNEAELMWRRVLEFLDSVS